MRLISHRGNIEKKINKKENDPDYLLNALDNGFDVEIDLRVNNSKIYLGHDFCKFRINEKFLLKFNKKLWIHAKNREALIYLENHSIKYNFFWHQEDLFTITSKGYIWTHYKSIKSLIRENKIHQVPTVMQTGLKDGMITMDKSIENLINDGLINFNDTQ